DVLAALGDRLAVIMLWCRNVRCRRRRFRCLLRPLGGGNRSIDHGWLGQDMRSWFGVFGIVLAAYLLDVVWVVGRRRAPCLRPSVDEVQHDQRSAKIFRNLPEQPRFAPGPGRLVPRKALPVCLVLDREKQAVERNTFKRRLDGRHVLDARTMDDVASGGGNQLVTKLTIGGGLLCGGGLRLPATFLPLAQP